MSLKVFVASSSGNRHAVRLVHDQLRALGMTPTARWCYAETPPGVATADWFFELPCAEQRSIVERTDADLAAAHAMLLVADERGRESYAEAARALVQHIAVIWTGYRTTSAIRPGVAYAQTVHDALRMLESIHQVAARPWPVDDDWARESAWRIVTTGDTELEATA